MDLYILSQLFGICRDDQQSLGHRHTFSSSISLSSYLSLCFYSICSLQKMFECMMTQFVTPVMLLTNATMTKVLAKTFCLFIFNLILPSTSPSETLVYCAHKLTVNTISFNVQTQTHTHTKNETSEHRILLSDVFICYRKYGILYSYQIRHLQTLP